MIVHYKCTLCTLYTSLESSEITAAPVVFSYSTLQFAVIQLTVCKWSKQAQSELELTSEGDLSCLIIM